MQRFFVPPETLARDETALPEDVSHHLHRVLRLAVGTEVLLLDGRGGVGRCRLIALGAQGATVRVLHRWTEPESALPIHLIQSLPKADKLELVLQKGTELGIVAFSPVLTERGVSHPADTQQVKRHQRWTKIVREAARQCQRPILPRLNEIRSLDRVLAACADSLRLMLWEEESRPLAEALPEAPPASVAILVGPEGGFGAREVELARQFGFQPVRLGPRILRSETAGFAVASILQYIYGDLGAAIGNRIVVPRKEPL